MASNTPVKVDPKELKRAENAWAAFGTASKWTIIAIVALLVFMAVVLL